jgi:hypothetical protein
MYKKAFLYCVLILFQSASCFNPHDLATKIFLTRTAWATGITGALVLIAMVPDKDSSIKEKIYIPLVSAAFSALLSGIVGHLTTRIQISGDLVTDAAKIARARNTGILCGLCLPLIAGISCYNGKNPKNLRNLLDTSVSLEKTFK